MQQSYMVHIIVASFFLVINYWSVCSHLNCQNTRDCGSKHASTSFGSPYREMNLSKCWIMQLSFPEHSLSNIPYTPYIPFSLRNLLQIFFSFFMHWYWSSMRVVTPKSTSSVITPFLHLNFAMLCPTNFIGSIWQTEEEKPIFPRESLSSNVLSDSVPLPPRSSYSLSYESKMLKIGIWSKVNRNNRAAA